MPSATTTSILWLRRAVTLHRCVDPNPDRQLGIGDNGRDTGINAGIPPRDINERAFRCDPSILDLPQEGIRPMLGTHLLEPCIRLPRRYRPMRPKHQQAVAGI